MSPGGRVGVVAAAVAGVLAVALAVALALTTPFTVGADVVTALAFVAMGAVAARTLARRRALGQARPSGAVGGAVARVRDRARLGRAWVVWALALAGLELGTYLAGMSGGRHAFPTLSSLIDEATRTTGPKVLVALVWLALGWGLFGQSRMES